MPQGGGFTSPCLLRTYCETDIDPSHRKYSQLQAAIRYLLGKEPDLECKKNPHTTDNTISTFLCALLN